MANRKENELKYFIQKIELDKPPVNFTELVMEEITAENEVVANPILQSLLKRHGVEKPSGDFTPIVMTQLDAHNFGTSYKPIISKQMWVSIVASVVLFIISLTLSEQISTSPIGEAPYLVNIGKMLNAIFIRINSVPSLYLLTLISVSILLIMDYLLKISNQSHRHRPYSGMSIK